MLSGRLGGVTTLESSREELEEKREPKRLAFSAEETFSYSTICTEKGRKARFTEVLRDAISRSSQARFFPHYKGFLRPTNLSFTTIPCSNESMKGEIGVRVNKSLISTLPSLYSM